MFSKKKNTPKLDPDQRELYDNARRRAKQKRRLFQHFVVFLVGAVLLIVVNVVIGFREDFQPLGYNWFVWAILIWTFFLLIHVLNVFIINSFMGKEWEQRQMNKLVRKQQERITELKNKVDRDYPLPNNSNEPAPRRVEGDYRKPNKPLDPDKPINH